MNYSIKNKYLIISAAPHSSSFTHKITKAIEEQLDEKKENYEHIDLYTREKQDFLDLEEGRESEKEKKKRDLWHKKILEAETLVFVYPIWRGNPPAILKNWLDQNLSSGFAFKYTKNGPQKLLKGKKAKVIATCGAPSLAYLLPIIGMRSFWKYFILGFCGIQLTGFKLIGNIRTRKRYPKKVEKILRKIKNMF